MLMCQIIKNTFEKIQKSYQTRFYSSIKIKDENSIQNKSSEFNLARNNVGFKKDLLTNRKKTNSVKKIEQRNTVINLKTKQTDIIDKESEDNTEDFDFKPQKYGNKDLEKIELEKRQNFDYLEKTPKSVIVGLSEEGVPIMRRPNLPEGIPTKLVERLKKVKSRSSFSNYQRIFEEKPLEDKDFDYVFDLKLPNLNFSNLGTISHDISSLFLSLQSLHFEFNSNRDAVIQAFESVVLGEGIKPMDPSTFLIGKELLELQIVKALYLNYPHLSHKALINALKNASCPHFLAEAILNLKLEPYIQLVPNIELSKFPDPAQICIELASNTYTSLIGVIFLEKGFETAISFIFDSLKLQKYSKQDMKSWNVFDGVKNSKITLFKILKKLRLPLPVYEMEKVKRISEYQYEYSAVVKSGNKIIGRGISSKKTLAESRAAADAIFNHWTTIPPKSEEVKNLVN